MYISQLKIDNFRNIDALELKFDEKVNFIIGENGSGKTSILESIFFLSFGRSFRTNTLARVINQNESDFFLFAIINTDVENIVAMNRNRNGKSINKLNYENQKNHSAITRLLPVQILTPESFNLINSGAKKRLKILDWGAFYSDKNFLKAWQQTQFLIKQRNSALKQKYPQTYIKSLDKKLVEFTELLDKKRLEYFTKLKPLILEILAIFNDDLVLDISYYRGWNKDKSLAEVLDEHYLQDQKKGVTQYGPHRADMRLMVNNFPACDIFSRGQQKLLIASIKLAQGELNNLTNSNKCVYLIDDIASELDDAHLEILFDYLLSLESQIFITFTDRSKVEYFSNFIEKYQKVELSI